MSTFGRYLHTIIDRGVDEARMDGSSTFEAHHLLLAIAAGTEDEAGEVLASVGLDRQAIRDALDKEFERSLNAVGVSLPAFELPRRTLAGRPGPGTSARLAFERGFGSAPRRRDLRPAHLLLGILQAPVGTVPRALALAGVGQADLRTRVHQTLADDTD